MRRLVSVAALCIVATGCSSSPSFTPEDLETIVLQVDEAPADTQFVSSESGAFTASDLTTDEEELAFLEAEGFLAAHDAIFASPGLAGVEGQISRTQAIIVDSSAFVFDEAEGAAASFVRQQGDVPSSFADVGTLFPIAVDDLGEQAFAVRVEFFRGAVGPDVGVLYVWRVENVLLRLAVFGEAVEEIADVRPIVDLVQSHVAPTSPQALRILYHSNL